MQFHEALAKARYTDIDQTVSVVEYADGTFDVVVGWPLNLPEDVRLVETIWYSWREPCPK